MTLSQIPKDRTVDALGSVWSSMRQLLGGLAEAQWAAPTSLPGWDVAANVAHVIGTERMLMGETPAAEVDRQGLDHVRNDIGAMNEAWVVELRELGVADLLAEFDRVTAARLATLNEMPLAEWDAESFTPAGTDSFGRFMQIRVFDSWFHEQDIREAVGKPGHGAGPAVVVALDEVTTALGFVVGKRAGVPQGSSVTFELTGTSGRTIHVDVAERARVVEDLGGPATVKITLPVLAFTRLCGGRTTIDRVRNDVEVSGDEALGEQILENLAYTI
ncbi:MAG: maleylpyruvate isomerase family mycothiol-dependent enzyme [Ilumatobacteraceae bacterium]